MCPFQYGVDFGLIGGLQAMRGFLMVRGFQLARELTAQRLTHPRSSDLKPQRLPWAGISLLNASN